MYTVPYEWYLNEYGGSGVSADSFSHLSVRASYLLNTQTFNRFKDFNPETADSDLLYAVNLTLCEITDTLDANSDGGYVDGRLVSSESVANWSVTYANGSGGGSSVVSKVRNTINNYLSGTYLTCMWL